MLVNRVLLYPYSSPIWPVEISTAIVYLVRSVFTFVGAGAEGLEKEKGTVRPHNIGCF